MDLRSLRQVMRPVISNLKDDCSNTNMPEFCERLGLAFPVEMPSKRQRMEQALELLGDDGLAEAARRLLDYGVRDQQARNAIQEILWSETPYPEIPKKYRKAVARSIDCFDHYGSAKHFDALLDELWVLDTDPLAGIFGSDDSLREAVEQHIHRNSMDWRPDDLFERLGAYEAADSRFAKFLEGLSSGDVRGDESLQWAFVDAVNSVLRECGAELRQTALIGGYPSFSLLSLHDGKRGGPKNLIFASQRKPDIRIRDAIDNDIEIVDSRDDVLVYDRPIGHQGLCWRDLQNWWAEFMQLQDATKAKESLYKRLRGSLPSSSPPQMLLYDTFHRCFGRAVPELPALLPEVWLHWDHKTVRERGVGALLRFRMDFLMLLPGGVRVVIEVDGKQHYANEKGIADVERYAQMMAADRELKLSGYEVYRFGAVELQGTASTAMLHQFFVDLFRRYGVVVPV